MNSQTNQPTENVAESNEIPKDPRVWIELPRAGRTASEFAEEVGEALAPAPFFALDGIPVRVNGDKIEPITATSFRTAPEKEIVFFKYRRKTKDENDPATPVPESMNEMQANVVLQSELFRKRLRSLRGVSSIPIPVFRDGKVILSTGYDPGTSILSTDDGGHAFDLMQKDVAVAYLRDLLREFPFADDEGRSMSVQIAAMMSRFASSLLPRGAQIPFIIWNANGPRAGKTLLAKIVEIVVRGFASIRALPESAEELQKVLDSEVLAGSSSIIFDNVKTKLDSPFLEQYATSSVVSVRRLGSSVKLDVEKRTMLMFTSNQAEVSADIAGRSLFCDLFVMEADPQSRHIDRILTEEFLSKSEIRYGILSALWSLIVAWDQSGRPAGSGRLAGFEDWGRIIGGIVENAGFGSPMRKPSSDHLGDSDYTDMESLVRIMTEGVFRDAIELNCREGITFEDLLWICRDRGLFDETIRGKVDRDTGEFILFNKSKVGKLFARYMGRVFQLGEAGAVKFERVGEKGRRRFRIC
jgi:hypothetical protein